MGPPFGSSEEEPKQKVVMGYPSIDRYHQAQNMYPGVPHGSTVPYPPQGYPPSSFQHQPRYVSSTLSFQQNQGYGSSPSFQYPQGKFASTAAQNPYSPSFNEYYYQQQPVKSLVPETSDSTSFGRVMLIMLIILIAIMCMMSLVMWSLFGTYIPEFAVTSFKVSNFSTTSDDLTGNWDASLTAKNSNDQPIHFDRVRSSIFYKEIMLGISQLQPFDLDKKGQSDLRHGVAAQASPTSGDKFPDWMLKNLGQDRSNGMVIFSLRLAMNANYTAPHLMNRQENLRVMCEYLQVKFSDTGEGSIASGVSSTCLIRKRDNLD